MFIGIANGYGRLYPFCLLSAYQSIFGIAIKPGGGRKTMVDGFMIKTSPDNFQISAALIFIYLPSLKGLPRRPSFRMEPFGAICLLHIAAE